MRKIDKKAKILKNLLSFTKIGGGSLRSKNQKSPKIKLNFWIKWYNYANHRIEYDDTHRTT